jgi:uncharacterized protein YgiM (DUF1202 family)
MVRHVKFLALVISVMFLLAASSSVIYVQSSKAKIMKSPSFKSKVVLTAKKGQELNVIKKKGRWYQVKAKGKTGWVSRLLVSKSKPIKKVSVFAKADRDISKSARRRASVMTTAAAARGLAEDDRRRLGAEMKMDYAAIERMESLSVSEAEVDDFVGQTR